MHEHLPARARSSRIYNSPYGSSDHSGCVVPGVAWNRSAGGNRACYLAALACYAFAFIFVFTGTAHFNRMKDDLVRMVPALFPRPLLLVYFTGVLEFVGAAGLLLPRFRSLAGICLIVLFPANVHAALTGATLAG